MRFSQRKGLKPIAEVIQTDSMNSELRNSLWNALDVEIWSSVRFVRHGDIDRFSKALWSDFFKEPIDSRPGPSDEIRERIRDRFFGYEWFEVYDFLEFVVEHYQKSKP